MSCSTHLVVVAVQDCRHRDMCCCPPCPLFKLPLLAFSSPCSQESYFFGLTLALPAGHEARMDHAELVRLLGAASRRSLVCEGLCIILQTALHSSSAARPSTQRLLAVLSGVGGSTAGVQGWTPRELFELAAGSRREVQDLILVVSGSRWGPALLCAQSGSGMGGKGRGSQQVQQRVFCACALLSSASCGPPPNPHPAVGQRRPDECRASSTTLHPHGSPDNPHPGCPPGGSPLPDSARQHRSGRADGGLLCAPS